MMSHETHAGRSAFSRLSTLVGPLWLPRHAKQLVQAAALACLASVASLAAAQENAIQSISANQQGANIIVRVSLKNRDTVARRVASSRVTMRA